MKKKKKLIPLIVILLLCAIIIPFPVRADFGDFAGDNDYGGGGGGGGGGGSSGSSSDGDGFFEILFYIFQLLGWKGSLIFIAAIIIIGMIRSKFSKKTPTVPIYSPEPETYDVEFDHISTYKNVDPNFSEAAFIEKLTNFYIHFQQSWEAKDISDLRPYLTDTLYAKSDRQLESYRKNNQTNHVDHPTVLKVEILGWKKDQGNHVIAAVLNTRIVDYVTDDNTGEVVKGSKIKEKFMAYEWRLIRSADKKTAVNTGISSVTCPYCGANVDINHSAVCEYCDSVIHDDRFDWVVSEIKGLSQRTV